MKFFLDVTVDRADAMAKMSPVHVPRRLPVVLSRAECARLIACASNLKHPAALSLAYGAGLRVREVVALKVRDIDSQRMTLRIDQGKGHKDRYAMLSPLLLERLRVGWRAARAQAKMPDGGWLFPGMDPVNPLTPCQLNRAIHTAAIAAAIDKRVTMHTLRHSYATHLGARIGAMLVLHTWGSAMTHHPHVHGIVPGGGISLDGERWVACKPGFFLPVGVLSRLFRRLFCQRLAQAHASGDLQFFGEYASLVDAAVFAAWMKPLRACEWVVYAKKPFAGPAAVLAYLSRYTHRAAISNPRLVSMDERGITFHWKDYRAKGRTRYKTMTLEADEFMRRFLLHVLPSGFPRIRHYGLMANADRREQLKGSREVLSQEPAQKPLMVTTATTAQPSIGTVGSVWFFV